MAILKTDAIILKGWKLGETSKILSLYTKDYGKIKVVAKGARGLKSKFRGCLEPLTHIKIVFYEKKTRELQLLSQADLISAHIHIIGNPKRTALGLAAAELLDKAVAGEESFPEMFDLIVSVLKAIDQKAGYLEGIFWFFESRFIDLMGYKPTWDQCLGCGKSLGLDGGFFQAENGGLLCGHCGAARGGLVVCGETLEILYWLQRTSIDDVDNLNPTQSQKAEIRRMFDLYFKVHIEHMKSLKSLKIFYDFEGLPL